MAGIITHLDTRPATLPDRAHAEPRWLQRLLIGVVLGFFALFLLLPLAIVFSEALAKGIGAYFQALQDSATAAAIRLTLTTAAVVVPCNTLFGLAAAWALSRFHFRGKSWLAALIDLPLWVSPVVGGLIYVLLLGSQGWLGPWLINHQVRIIFAVPGIILVTLFVTFPFVARTLVPLMQTQGMAEEEAAMTLGASGWQIFFRITLPKIKWALFYGIILCNARAMGEFGAVSVVSGHIRGKTNTMPLQVEMLYNEYAFTSAFALASVLALLALVTLGLKTVVEWRARQSATSNTPVR
jgi:sulfate transport system permease protein